MATSKTAVIVPNWNGKHRLKACLDSLIGQSELHEVFVVENGSTDGSVGFLDENYPDITVLKNKANLGFAGGVNTGIRFALAQGYDYIALLNNDAQADKDWLKQLVAFLNQRPEAGIVTSKMYAEDGKRLDSTGDTYSVWGLPFPRGRDEIDNGQYDNDVWIFGASGGASLYRAKMLEQIGLFDEDFFAYYEDVDISFRAQLAGWKVGYEPKAIVTHQIGGTSKQIKGFATYHTLKNLPLLLWKNVPFGMFSKIWLRLMVAYLFICAATLLRGQFAAFFKGIFMGTILWPKKLWQRRSIQKARKVPVSYIDSIITHDLPPNAKKLRRVRAGWWKLRGKHA